jgi:hypothetical protein
MVALQSFISNHNGPHAIAFVMPNPIDGHNDHQGLPFAIPKTL